MSGESGINGGFDELESMSYEEPSDLMLDGRRFRPRNGCITGRLLIFCPIGLVVIVTSVSTSQLAPLILPMFVGVFALTMVGIGILMIYGVGSTSLLKPFEILDWDRLNHRFEVDMC